MSNSHDPDGSGCKPHTPKKKLFDLGWTWRVFLLSFAVSVVLSLSSEAVSETMDVAVGIVVLVLFIAIGILFDILGIAVATADPSTFNAMAAKGVRGSRASLWLISRSAVVANFCNDVIGDVCGVLCGTTSVVIAMNVAGALSLNVLMTTVIMTSFTSALIVGGKSLFKTLAMKKSNDIVFAFARVLCFVVPEKSFKKKKQR